jgi:predicted phage-related endonuclease
MDAQRSEEWFSARVGRITASRMCDVMAFTVGEGFYKSGPRKGQPKVATPLKARTDYIVQLAAERLTGNAKALVSAGPLDWGKQWEPIARAEYENRTGVLVQEAGFIVHPEYNFIGASADFLVAADGGGEMKCPFNQEVHLQTLERGLPDEHIEQIQGGLWVTNRQWWDFVSFHHAFPPHLQLYVQRVPRDDAYIAKLADACLSLNDEVRAIVQRQMRNAA